PATATTPVAVTAPVAAPTAPAPPSPAGTVQLDQVAAQVFPEVTGLVSRGDGTHRITLTLNPEQLGEVRVVMTMRAGAVHVRLAAGQDARASLVEGSGELGRLLERAGATDTHIVVRELPSAAASPSTPTPTAPGAAPGTDRGPDQHAGTRADQQARDGSDRSTPQNPGRSQRTGTTTAVRSIQPATGSRTAGLDLTM
ncbi:MAG: flagellar hook-length control protein FliK, partial [Marmoricola sp.]